MHFIIDNILFSINHSKVSKKCGQTTKRGLTNFVWKLYRGNGGLTNGEKGEERNISGKIIIFKPYLYFGD